MKRLEHFTAGISQDDRHKMSIPCAQSIAAIYFRSGWIVSEIIYPPAKTVATPDYGLFPMASHISSVRALFP